MREAKRYVNYHKSRSLHFPCEGVAIKRSTIFSTMQIELVDQISIERKEVLELALSLQQLVPASL
jgi:hypothetical protein